MNAVAEHPGPDPEQSRLLPWLAGYLLAYAIYGWLSAGRGPAYVLGADIAYLPFRLTATGMLALAAASTKNRGISRGWWLLAAGQCFAVVGNITWIYTDLTGLEVETAGYLGWTVPYGVLVTVGFWSMMRSGTRRTAAASDWVDAAILIVSAAVVAWYFVAARVAREETTEVTSAVLFFSDEVSHIGTTLLAVVVWLRAPGGLVRRAALRLWIALALLAATDLVFDSLQLDETYRNGSLIDIAYALAVILIALAAEAQWRRPEGDPPGDPARVDHGDLVVFGATLGALLPLAIEVAKTDVTRYSMGATGLGVVVLMLLVLWRQRLARREIDYLIAGRLRLEHELWQAQKQDAVGRLAGGIAHDFNNILAGISAHAQLLRSGASTDVNGETSAIEFATQRAAVLVRRLLTFSRTGTHVHRPVVLGEVVRSMEPMLRQLLVPGVTLDVRVDDGDAVVILADGQLEQVLLNLAINARDAAEERGHISIATRRSVVQPRDGLNGRGVQPGTYAVLEVRDDGRGMDEGVRAQLFQPYFTTKANTGGTGLGLATVAGIVQAADGHIVVDSARGAGTTMTVLIPVSGDLAPPDGDDAAVRGHVRRIGTVLVVDDELPIRSALSRYLGRVGYRVVEAADARQALSQLDQMEWKVDCILTDLRMPDLTGTELARRVRTRRDDLPVLFMSGFADAPLRGDTDPPPPAADTINKPFDLAFVAEMVGARIQAQRARSS